MSNENTSIFVAFLIVEQCCTCQNQTHYKGDPGGHVATWEGENGITLDWGRGDDWSQEWVTARFIVPYWILCIVGAWAMSLALQFIFSFWYYLALRYKI